MSKHIAMTAVSRERAGKGNARATRRQGQVPAVIYGDNKPPVLIAIDNMPITKALHSGHLFTHLTDIDIGGQKQLVLARDVQMHPIKDIPTHVDFLRVSEKTVITVEVPLHATNFENSPAAKEGGSLTLVHHTLEVSCRADQIPEYLEVDMAKAEIGDTVHVSDLKLPANVKSTLDAEETLISVAAPMAEEVIETAAPVANMDVEVTGQKAPEAGTTEGGTPNKDNKENKDGKK
jgi:large subunit ribosomal protein L25